MLPLRRMTTNAASIRRRASLAYVARRSVTARSAIAASTGTNSARSGTTFCTPGTVFRIRTEGQPRLPGLPGTSGSGALLEPLDQEGPLDLAGRRGAGEGLDDRHPPGLLEPGQPALA